MTLDVDLSSNVSLIVFLNLTITKTVNVHDIKVGMTQANIPPILLILGSHLVEISQNVRFASCTGKLTQNMLTLAIAETLKFSLLLAIGLKNTKSKLPAIIHFIFADARAIPSATTTLKSLKNQRDLNLVNN